MPEDFELPQAPPFNHNGDNQGERSNDGGPMQRPDQGDEQLKQETVIDKNTIITMIVCVLPC